MKVSSWLTIAGEALRGTPAGTTAPVQSPRAKMFVLGLIGLGFAALYVGTMGTFPDASGGVRPLQMLYSGLKVALLLMVTFVVALPSYFVLNTLLACATTAAMTCGRWTTRKPSSRWWWRLSRR